MILGIHVQSLEIAVFIKQLQDDLLLSEHGMLLPELLELPFGEEDDFSHILRWDKPCQWVYRGVIIAISETKDVTFNSFLDSVGFHQVSVLMFSDLYGATSHDTNSTSEEDSL